MKTLFSFVPTVALLTFTISTSLFAQVDLKTFGTKAGKISQKLQTVSDHWEHFDVLEITTVEEYVNKRLSLYQKQEAFISDAKMMEEFRALFVARINTHESEILSFANQIDNVDIAEEIKKSVRSEKRKALETFESAFQSLKELLPFIRHRQASLKTYIPRLPKGLTDEEEMIVVARYLKEDRARFAVPIRAYQNLGYLNHTTDISRIFWGMGKNLNELEVMLKDGFRAKIGGFFAAGLRDEVSIFKISEDALKSINFIYGKNRSDVLKIWRGPALTPINCQKRVINATFIDIRDNGNWFTPFEEFASEAIRKCEGRDLKDFHF